MHTFENFMVPSSHSWILVQECLLAMLRRSYFVREIIFGVYYIQNDCLYTCTVFLIFLYYSFKYTIGREERIFSDSHLGNQYLKLTLNFFLEFLTFFEEINGDNEYILYHDHFYNQHTKHIRSFPELPDSILV